MTRRLLLFVLVLACWPAAVWGAIERTGSVGQFGTGQGNTGSQDITVPADATLALVYVVGYGGVANVFSGGAVTLGGGAMTPVSGGDASTSLYQGAAFYRVNPATGTQPLAWDWVGTGTIPDGAIFVYEFWKGIDTGSPVRDTYGTQSNPQYSTDSLTALSGDKVAVWVFAFVNDTEGSVTTWSNATEVYETTRILTSDGTVAEASPSGNVTIATTAVSAYQDGGIMAIVVKPAAGAPIVARHLMLLGAGL